MGPSISLLVAKLWLPGQCDFSQPVARLCAVLGRWGEQVSETVCNVLPSPHTETVQLNSTGVLHEDGKYKVCRSAWKSSFFYAAYLREPFYAAYLREPFYAAYLRELFTRHISENPFTRHISENPFTRHISENPFTRHISENPFTRHISENPLRGISPRTHSTV